MNSSQLKTQKKVTNVEKQFSLAANNLDDDSGGEHSGKSGLMMYSAKVKDWMAPVQGRTMMHSIQSRTKAARGPRVTWM